MRCACGYVHSSSAFSPSYINLYYVQRRIPKPSGKAYEITFHAWTRLRTRAMLSQIWHDIFELYHGIHTQKETKSLRRPSPIPMNTTQTHSESVKNRCDLRTKKLITFERLPQQQPSNGRAPATNQFVMHAHLPLDFGELRETRRAPLRRALANLSIFIAY